MNATVLGQKTPYMSYAYNEAFYFHILNIY